MERSKTVLHPRSIVKYKWQSKGYVLSIILSIAQRVASLETNTGNKGIFLVGKQTLPFTYITACEFWKRFFGNRREAVQPL